MDSNPPTLEGDRKQSNSESTNCVSPVTENGESSQSMGSKQSLDVSKVDNGMKEDTCIGGSKQSDDLSNVDSGMENACVDSKQPVDPSNDNGIEEDCVGSKQSVDTLKIDATEDACLGSKQSVDTLKIDNATEDACVGSKQSVDTLKIDNATEDACVGSKQSVDILKIDNGVENACVGSKQSVETSKIDNDTKDACAGSGQSVGTSKIDNGTEDACAGSGQSVGTSKIDNGTEDACAGSGQSVGTSKIDNGTEDACAGSGQSVGTSKIDNGTEDACAGSGQSADSSKTDNETEEDIVKVVDNNVDDLKDKVIQREKETVVDVDHEAISCEKGVDNSDEALSQNCVDRKEQVGSIVENGSSESPSHEDHVIENAPISPHASDNIGREVSGDTDIAKNKQHLCELKSDKGEILEETDEVEVKEEGGKCMVEKDEEKLGKASSDIDEGEKTENICADLEVCETKDKASNMEGPIPADNKFDNTTCDLLIFDMKGENKKSEEDSVLKQEGSNADIMETSSKKGSYVPPVFEDITEDEDSEDEQFENIELELDDLIDTPDASLNSSGQSGGNGLANSTIPKGDTDIKSSNSSTEMKNSSECASDVIKNSETVNGAIGNHRIESSEISDSQTKSTEKPIMMKKKSTARKSGRPVSQLESAPLKKINMYPITDVTMNISEVEEALKFDLDHAKKMKKSDIYVPSIVSDVDTGPGNTYKVISVTKSNLPPTAASKKKRKKRGYDLPGCNKKKKKFKLSDDVASIGASSIDSVSLSESDLMESDSISSCSSTHVSSLSELSNNRESSNSTTNSSSVSLVSSPLPSSSLSSVPTSSVSSSSTPAHSKPGNNHKGSNKMKTVLEMLHERNRKKAASEDGHEKVGGGLASGKGPVTTNNTTTTTTIMVSPPDSKPIVEGLKRKGTPRKRRDDVICVSDDDDDDAIIEIRPKGKRNSSDYAEVINTTTTSMVPTKIPNFNNIVTSGGPAPVVMMVAQHSNTPGLRSLLPRNMLVSAPGGTMGMAMVRPENVSGIPTAATHGGNILTPLPLVSTLPVGMKAVSMASLPPGLSTIPFTSLPPGSTIFTAVQGNNQGGIPTPLPPGATFLNVTPPKTSVTNNNNGNKPSLKSHHPSSCLSPSASTKASSKSKQAHSLLAPLSQQKQSAQQVNSESLRALLVGNPYQNVTPSSASSVLFTSSTFPSSSLSTSTTPMNSSPVVFQMLTSKSPPNNSSLATTPTLVPLQPATTHKKILPHQVKLSAGSAAPQPPNKVSAIHSYSSIKPIPQSVMPPNGVSCLTPPKTPDTDSSSEVLVAASLTRPVGGQFEDNDVIPLCCCKINVPAFNKMLAGVTYCQALDSVDNKVLGCCNKVTSSQLVRPGVKIPFMAVCEVHRKRLAMHQCCPGCGHFCSQGKFQQCRKEGTSSVHNFHKQCMFYRGGKHFCPHCGEETSLCEVELKLKDDGSASTNRVAGKGTRNKDAEKKTSARLGVGGKKSKSTKECKSLTLPNKKSVDPSTLPPGPDLATLTRLCKCLGEDRPKKYRTLPKDLYSPAAEGDMEKVFYLLADGMDPNVRSEENDDQTPLHAAAVYGSVGTVFVLEQFGAEVHAQDRSLQTPLMCAAENGHVKVVNYLLKAGAKVEDRGEDGMTGLHYAAKAGHLDVIKLLLNTKRLDINVEDDGGWTPIIWATESMLPNIVRYLIGQGGDPNQKDNEENTSLHWAAFSGSVEICEMLLDLGCELDTPNEHGDRPLHIAARQDHYDIVVHLLAKGANVDVKNHKNETPVDACVNKTGQVSMALKVNQQLRGLATYKLIQPERLLDRDITMGREKNPVACVNKEDNEPCPTDYLYIIQNVETTPLNINAVITGLQSCRCKDDCSSMYCVCARSSVCCWYDKTGRLVEDFNLLEPPLVFECNRACRCWVNCNNRVVQNGIVCRLQLFRTNGRGWGVRALMDIPKGTFVCEYIGELISDSEADRREDDSYLFDLDNKDGDTYCIDARKYGNVARFINHLCEPNLVPVKVFVEHQDLRFPRICFFSSREIKAYEELGFDYGEKFWIIKWKQFTCACQSDKCKYSKDTIQKTLDDYKLRYPDETMDQD